MPSRASHSSVPASRRLHDHHEHAAGGNAAPLAPHVQVQPTTTERPVPFRVCLPPSRAKHLRHSTAPDSTRLLALVTGRVGVIFSRSADGKRPPSKAVDTESEAQRLVSAHRQSRRGGAQ